MIKARIDSVFFEIPLEGMAFNHYPPPSLASVSTWDFVRRNKCVTTYSEEHSWTTNPSSSWASSLRPQSLAHAGRSAASLTAAAVAARHASRCPPRFRRRRCRRRSCRCLSRVRLRPSRSRRHAVLRRSRTRRAAVALRGRVARVRPAAAWRMPTRVSAWSAVLSRSLRHPRAYTTARDAPRPAPPRARAWENHERPRPRLQRRALPVLSP